MNTKAWKPDPNESQSKEANSNLNQSESLVDNVKNSDHLLLLGLGILPFIVSSILYFLLTQG